jgi:hypothetical protein
MEFNNRIIGILAVLGGDRRRGRDTPLPRNPWHAIWLCLFPTHPWRGVDPNRVGLDWNGCKGHAYPPERHGERPRWLAGSCGACWRRGLGFGLAASGVHGSDRPSDQLTSFAGGGRPLPSIGTGIGIAIFLFIFFGKLLRVPLPFGVFEGLLS